MPTNANGFTMTETSLSKKNDDNGAIREVEITVYGER